ncbi:EamA family transporter [Candidatus Berkelbacteria bacterium]|nr:EamA family transporter [Candidatus Berkelbacteria bacterium]
MIWLPVLTLFVGLARTLSIKAFLTRSRIPEAEYLTSTTFLAGLMAAFVSWRAGVLPELTELVEEPIWLLVSAAYTVVATVAVWLFYRGFREESLTRYQLAELLSPICILLFAGIIFPEERDLRLYAVAGLALVAFAIGHLSGQRFRFQHGERILILVAILYGFEAVFERLLIGQFSSLTVFLIRQIGLVTALTLVLGFHLHEHLFSKRFWGVLFASVLGFGYAMALFESYRYVGVTASNVIFLAGPVLLSAWASRVGGEREPLRIYAAGTVILAAIAYTVFLVQ